MQIHQSPTKTTQRIACTAKTLSISFAKVMYLDWHFHPFLYLVIISIFHFSSTSSASESEALLRLKKSFTNAGALSSWIPGSVPCNRQTHWNGLLCFNGIVTGLQLENMGLSGTIDVDALAAIHGTQEPKLCLIIIPLQSLKKVRLSDNKFTGGIPPSLAELPRLSELHLEKNQFSGTIPSIDQPALMSFNVSNNKLEGEIPPNLAIFNNSSFDGNDHLCGDKFGRGCENTAQTSSESPTGAGLDADMMVRKDSDHSSNNVIKTVGGGPAVIIFRMRRRDKDFDVIENRRMVMLQQQHSRCKFRCRIDQKGMGATKKMGSSRKGSNNGRGGAGELVIVNTEKGAFEVLGNGGMGPSYKARMANGVMVVVKRTREMNTLSKDEFDAEIRKLGRLHHANILTPLAFHYQPDEKLLIVQGIAEGLGYLHTKLASSHLPHGNLKSSNVFLSDGSEPLLSECGLRPLISPPTLAQALFGYKAPEAAQHGGSSFLKSSQERNPEQRLNITDAIQMIQGLKLERTIQALPSPRSRWLIMQMHPRPGCLLMLPDLCSDKKPLSMTTALAYWTDPSLLGCKSEGLTFSDRKGQRGCEESWGHGEVVMKGKQWVPAGLFGRVRLKGEALLHAEREGAAREGRIGAVSNGRGAAASSSNWLASSSHFTIISKTKTAAVPLVHLQF
uniref:Leucine-rich repeat-containing N-terminal plant-type domain-containing protein n=1 Tax=Salix viminalis TaxID=40686 RepID=A0A6N2K5N1_SALVM